ncbi:MAG: fatty acid desaturase [Gammaproteobacteria bacterium]
MWGYAKYGGTHLLIVSAAVGLLVGGIGSWLGFLAGVVGWIGMDSVSGRAGPMRSYGHPRILDCLLYSFLPMVAALCAVFAWYLSPPDLFGLGATVERWSRYPVLARKADRTVFDLAGAVLSVGLAVALGAILTAHELMHRVHDRVAMFVARWLLALAFNSSLEVAHVFGHHRDVGTPRDPATARRGENVYAFWVRSSLGQVPQAWRIERERLRGRPWWQALLTSNKVTRGFMRAFVVAGLFGACAGPPGLAAFVLASMFNKLLLEALNYLEHYGLVRNPSTPYALRHAWDTDRAFSQVVLINLPMHSEHHLDPRLHFESLRARPDETPILPWGYLAALVLTLLPPLWHRLIAPSLAEWDRRFATDEERALAAG